MKFKKTVSLILAFCVMLTAFSGCSLKNSMEIGGVKISSGIYIINILEATGVAIAKSEAENPAALWKKTIDGKNAKDWVADKALEMCYQYAAVEKLFKENGLLMTNSDFQAVQEASNQLSEEKVALYRANSVSSASVENILMNEQKKQKLLSTIYDKGGSKEIPENDISKFFSDNYYKFELLYLPLSNMADGEPFDTPEIDAYKTVFNGYADQLKAGVSFEEVYKLFEKFYEEEKKKAETAASGEDATSDASSEDVSSDTSSEDVSSDVSSEDPLTPSEREKQKEQEAWQTANSRMMYVRKDNEQYPTELLNKLAGMGNETVESFADEQYVYTAFKHDPVADAKFIEQMKATLIQDMKGEEFLTYLLDYAKTLDINLNQSEMNRYKPNKLKLEGE